MYDPKSGFGGAWHTHTSRRRLPRDGRTDGGGDKPAIIWPSPEQRMFDQRTMAAASLSDGAFPSRPDRQPRNPSSFLLQCQQLERERILSQRVCVWRFLFFFFFLCTTTTTTNAQRRRATTRAGEQQQQQQLSSQKLCWRRRRRRVQLESPTTHTHAAQKNQRTNGRTDRAEAKVFFFFLRLLSSLETRFVRSFEGEEE